MIELNGTYKLKKIKGFNFNDTSDYKVIKIYESNVIICKKLNGEDSGRIFGFMKDFLIDPEKPDEIYTELIVERN